MKNMKKSLFLLVLPFVVVSGVVFANRETKNETKPSEKSLSIADKKAADLVSKKKWEATPAGKNYKEWEVSPEGKKVHASNEKISKDIKAFNSMEAVVTSVTFQRSGKSAAIKWLIVKINDDEYMMQYSPKDFEQLKSLKVNDKIIVKSRSAGYSHNHPYLIISGDYIEHNTKVLFKRDFSKNKGC